MGPIADDFLPSLYRSTLILGVLATAGISIGLRSQLWAGSFLFGVLASLAFLKSQEIFLKRILAISTPQPTSKSPKSIWVLMVGKYFFLAAIMAAGLRFQILNLIAFVFGFALLHAVMLVKVVTRRTGNRLDTKNAASAEVPQHGTLNA